MIEDLTKEKLVRYGFSETQIERLYTWENYNCGVIGNQGYLWASNTEQKIYSGIEGREKHFSKSILPQYHKEPKEKFETFHELFSYAILVGSIERPKGDLSFSPEESLHNFNFNAWLQNYKGWEYDNEIQYKELLTRESWVAYLEHCEEELEQLKEQAKTISSKWKPQRSAPREPNEGIGINMYKKESTFISSMKNGINMKMAFNPEDGVQFIKRYSKADHSKYKRIFEENTSYIKNTELLKHAIDKELKEALSDLMDTDRGYSLRIIDECLRDSEKLLNALKEILPMYSHFDGSHMIEFYNENIERVKKINKIEYLQDKLESIEGVTEKQEKRKAKLLKGENNSYTQRQIAIAYCIMDILITSENAANILKKHSHTRSTDKLLSKRINNPSCLTKLTGNKTADTKSKNDLYVAKRLISGMKKPKAIKDITRIISAFEANYHNNY